MKKLGLQLTNISFSLPGKEKPFFDIINLFFEAGKVHFISGQNGSGKSTLFRIIHGDIHPREELKGNFILDGHSYEIQNNFVPIEYSSHVKQVIQNIDSMLVNTMTVAQNLGFARMPQFVRLSSFAPDEISDSLLVAAGIGSSMKINILSGGQRQLVATVMAYQNSGRVLLLDEPTAALDIKNADLVMKFICEFAREKNLIILVICHDSDIVEKYCTGLHARIHVDAHEKRSIEIIE